VANRETRIRCRCNMYNLQHMSSRQYDLSELLITAFPEGVWRFVPIPPHWPKPGTTCAETIVAANAVVRDVVVNFILNEDKKA